MLSFLYTKVRLVGPIQIDNDFEGIDENDNDYFDDDFVWTREAVLGLGDSW